MRRASTLKTSVQNKRCTAPQGLHDWWSPTKFRKQQLAPVVSRLASRKKDTTHMLSCYCTGSWCAPSRQQWEDLPSSPSLSTPESGNNMNMLHFLSHPVSPLQPFSVLLHQQLEEFRCLHHRTHGLAVGVDIPSLAIQTRRQFASVLKSRQ